MPLRSACVHRPGARRRLWPRIRASCTHPDFDPHRAEEPNVTHRVFIDGQEGTTGLQIFERLGKRPDIQVLEIAAAERKDAAARAALMDQADVVILCLPDAAAVEAVGLAKSPRTKVIDAS